MKFGVYSGVNLMCQECGEKVQTLVVNGTTIYRHRPDLYDKVFLQCPKCHNYVSADPLRSQDSFKSWAKRHSKKVIPNATCRKARRKIHWLIDPVWQRGIMTRAEIYKRLGKATGVRNYHNGSLGDNEISQKALAEAEKIRREATILGLDKTFRA